VVKVDEGGDVTQLGALNGAPTSMGGAAAPAAGGAVPAAGGEAMKAPLSGNIWKVEVAAGEYVEEGDVIVILEAMKMETEVRASKSGTVGSVSVKEGDSVSVGDTLLTIA